MFSKKEEDDTFLNDFNVEDEEEKYNKELYSKKVDPEAQVPELPPTLKKEEDDDYSCETSIFSQSETKQ